MTQTDRLSHMLDRTEINDLIRRERFARDQRHWAVMRDCFHDDAHIRTSWFDGGAAEYVEASRIRHGDKGASKHWVFPSFLNVNGDRATAESPAMIFDRFKHDGIEVDLHVFCRFFSRVMQVDGEWKLMSFELLLERDLLRCVNPSDPLPVDWKELAGYRPSYQFLTLFQETRGVRVNPNLYGDDRPDDLRTFYAGEAEWLDQG